MSSLRATGFACLLVTAMWGGSARAETPEELFDRGNAAYERGAYEEAAVAYGTVLRYGIRDSRVEYNLGNAYFKMGRLGQSILHYERAHRLAPTDPDIRGNLELARSRCFDRVEPEEVALLVRWLRAVQDRLGPDRHALVFLGLVWIVASLATWASARPGGWNAGVGWALAPLLLATTLVGVSWYTTYDRLEGKRLAVVLVSAVEVLAGPGENNASLFTVHEGLTLQLRAERPEWVQVSLPNGLHGWVPTSSVGLL